MEARLRKKSAKRVKSSPSSSSSSCFIANLPNPLLMEILCRMSFKTLTTSKGVCKSWLNLIKDPKFCRKHQSRSPTEVCFQPNHDKLELHLGNFRFPNNSDPCHFEILKFSDSPQNIPNYNALRDMFTFANSCNGLLCYYVRDRDHSFALVWNPCTSEFITFPPPPSPSPCNGYGLGFSRKENKFKLLRLIGGRKPSSRIVAADVCTIEKSCSWKRVGPCSSLARVSNLHAVFLQGTLHWVAEDSKGNHIAIHTFDCEDDRFGTLPLPPRFDKKRFFVLNGDRLGVLAGCLFTSDFSNGGVTFWSMREYGVQASWTKLFQVGLTVDNSIDYYSCLPVTYMDNGEILMRWTNLHSTVFVYDPVLKIDKVVGTGPYFLQLIAFNPSLVLLKDSMLGYDVHVIPKCAGLQQGQNSTTPHWWAPMENQWSTLKQSGQQHGSQAPRIDDELSDARAGEGHVSATSESSASEESSPSATSYSSASKESSPSATSEPSASKESPARIAGQSQEHIGEGNATLLPEQDELVQDMTPVEANKSRLALTLKIEKLRLRGKELEQRDKELEHRDKKLEQRDKELKQRDKELEHRDKMLDQRDKMLNILQELDNTDQSRMLEGELAHHLSKIKRYENLVARTFDQ